MNLLVPNVCSCQDLFVNVFNISQLSLFVIIIEQIDNMQNCFINVKPIVLLLYNDNIFLASPYTCRVYTKCFV